MLLSIHIAAGGLAIVLGAVALLVKKGGTIHRRSGLLFVYSMLVLGTTAALLGFRKSPTDGNVFGGLMTVYFVGTALTIVRPVSAWTRRSNVAALTVAVGLALVDIAGGVKAFNSPRGLLNGVPFVMYFFIAGVMILAATGDVRIMTRTPNPLIDPSSMMTYADRRSPSTSVPYSQMTRISTPTRPETPPVALPRTMSSAQ